MTGINNTKVFLEGAKIYIRAYNFIHIRLIAFFPFLPKNKAFFECYRLGRGKRCFRFSQKPKSRFLDVSRKREPKGRFAQHLPLKKNLQKTENLLLLCNKTNKTNTTFYWVH